MHQVRTVSSRGMRARGSINLAQYSDAPWGTFAANERESDPQSGGAHRKRRAPEEQSKLASADSLGSDWTSPEVGPGDTQRGRPTGLRYPEIASSWPDAPDAMECPGPPHRYEYPGFMPVSATQAGENHGQRSHPHGGSPETGPGSALDPHRRVLGPARRTRHWATTPTPGAPWKDRMEVTTRSFSRNTCPNTA
jgi:hypothetical protein